MWRDNPSFFFLGSSCKNSRKVTASSREIIRHYFYLVKPHLAIILPDKWAGYERCFNFWTKLAVYLAPNFCAELSGQLLAVAWNGPHGQNFSLNLSKRVNKPVSQNIELLRETDVALFPHGVDTCGSGGRLGLPI